ncbi:restriction endonuclease subunit S [Vibrio splendidus]|nr:restriction endonuclease subunit S [Vibrio splendidus]
MTVQMNAPTLRFGEFEGQWSKVTFDDLNINVIDGDRGTQYPNKNELLPEGYCLFLSAKNVTKSGFQFSEMQFITQEKDGLLRKGKLKRGDIVLTTRGSVGHKALYTDEVVFDSLRINSGMVLLRHQWKELSNEFVYKSMFTRHFTKQIDVVAFGSAQPALTVKEIKKLKLSVPPTLPEQQKIASFLSKIDEKIGLLSEKKDKLTEYKRGVMQQLFNGKWHEQDGQLNFVPPTLRFKADDGSEFPAWEEREFDDIFNFSTGKNIKQNEASPEFDTPCVRYGELYHMYGEVITTVVNGTNLEHSELTFSNGNEILLPSAGEDPLDIGSASALTLSDVAIGRTINVLRPKGNIDYCPVYVSFYINEKLRKKISTLARGASISNVYNSDLRGLSLPLPSIEEQYVIKSFLLKIEEKLKLTNSELEKAKEWKKGLLQQMFV